MTAEIWIYCRFCDRSAPLAEFVRMLHETPVSSGGTVVGWVAVLRHRECRTATAVPVRVD